MINSKINPKLWIFKYLWILIVLPKEIQLFVLLGIILLMLIKYRFKLSAFPLLILIMCIIQSVAVCSQVFINDSMDFSRVLAAINTILMWIVGLILFGIFNGNISETDIRKISKYMFINILILFGLYLISLFVDRASFSFAGFTWYLRRMDYLTTGSTTRFCGLMETVLGPSHFFIFAFPISLAYVKKWKFSILKIIYCILAFIPIYETNSRVGILVCGVITILGIVFLLRSQFKIQKKIFSLFMFAFAAVVICLAVLNINVIMSEICDFWNLRGGSNGARFNIYYQSLLKMWNESPLIGIGIKYMLGDFPYGSHSTYIGILYKTGLLGFSAFLIATIILISKIYKQNKFTSFGVFQFVSILGYFAFILFADIDSSNWVTAFVFSVFAICSSKVNFSTTVLKDGGDI